MGLRGRRWSCAFSPRAIPAISAGLFQGYGPQLGHIDPGAEHFPAITCSTTLGRAEGDKSPSTICRELILNHHHLPSAPPWLGWQGLALATAQRCQGRDLGSKMQLGSDEGHCPELSPWLAPPQAGLGGKGTPNLPQFHGTSEPPPAQPWALQGMGIPQPGVEAFSIIPIISGGQGRLLSWQQRAVSWDSAFPQIPISRGTFGCHQHELSTPNRAWMSCATSK